VCTGGACTTSSCPFGYVFCDDFEDGVADGWTKSGGTWSVLDEAGDKVYQGGASEESWAGSSSTDQTVTAMVRVVQFGGSSDSYRAGILARRSTPSDFYALQVRYDGMLSIRKGTTPLSGCQIQSGVTVTQWFEMKLQVSGPPASVTLRGFVNGEGTPKLTCTHTNGIASGQAGFVTYGTGTTARFDDITVSTP
jgi:pectate lyase